MHKEVSRDQFCHKCARVLRKYHGRGDIEVSLKRHRRVCQLGMKLKLVQAEGTARSM